MAADDQMEVKYPGVDTTELTDPVTDATKLVGGAGAANGVPELGTGKILTAEEREERDAVMGYDEQIAALKAAAAAIRRETPEQRAKRERQEKSRRIIGATVDGLSALSNLFFTTQYAPNAYNPQSSQLGKVNERIEALKAEREADADRYNNYMMRLGDVQTAKTKTLRDMKAQHEAQKLAREKAERDAETHSWQALLQPDKQREQKGKADRAIYEAGSAYEVMLNKPEELRLKNETEVARKGSYVARTVASYASANASNASAAATIQKMEQEKAEKPYAYDEHGNKHHFEKESTAEAFARSHGTWHEYEVRKKTIVTDTGDKEGTRTTETVEKRGYSQKKKESPTAGGGAGKKSPTS